MAKQNKKTKQVLYIDTGKSRTIVWGSAFAATSIALPTTVTNVSAKKIKVTVCTKDNCTCGR